MATARDRAFKILTEREIGAILQDRVGRHPRPTSSLTCEEFESGTPYWGTWEALPADDDLPRRNHRGQRNTR